MPKKPPATTGAAVSKRKAAGKKAALPKTAAANSVASRLSAPSAATIEAAKKKYEQGIVARGEAVEAGKPLPPGATHEIAGYRPDGSPILKRKRFSAF